MKPGRKKVSALWAFTLVIIVLILTLGYLGISALETAENIIRPERKVTIDSIIYSTIGELKKESKIVVMTGEVNLSVKRSHTKFFSRLNLGTTAVEVLVPKNKVQYVIPTDAISEESFRWNDETGEVSIEIPTPVIDEEIVEIQSDPSLIKVRKEIGWGRFESRSGEFLERQIRQDLRSLVIEEGKGNKLMLEQAKKNAQEVIRELFETFMRKENLEVPVQTLVN